MAPIASTFSLRKWYLDCVATDGTVWIGYWGDLRWRSLHIPFVSSLVVANGDSTAANAMRAEKEPKSEEGRVTWSAPSLGVEVSLIPGVSGAKRQLHDLVNWHCVVPCGDVTVRLPGRTIVGRGYAEVLELAVPPWRLPLRALRWGRFTGEQTSLVWVGWSGAAPLRAAVCDGAFAEVTAIDDQEVRLGDGKRLTMTGRSVLREETLANTLKPLRPLAALLPRSLSGSVEQKWRSRGTMFAGDRPTDRPIDEGWVIHELFTFGTD